MVLLEILASVILISTISFAGVIGLALGEERFHRLLKVFIAFASGSLLAAAFLDMMPEAMKEIGEKALPMVLFGLIVFFIVEKFIHWHHCGKEECDMHPTAYLNLLGGSVHNAMDGVTIAAAYIASIPLGVVTTIAISMHEIPREFGDFSVLVHCGMKPRKALYYNFISATTAVLGAVLGFVFLSKIQAWVPYVVSAAAGGFIYVATADLMPELHKENRLPKLLSQSFALIAGVLVLYFALTLLPEV